jgi:hypothetical protein
MWTALVLASLGVGLRPAGSDPAGARYYLDSTSGDDAHDGRSRRTAWRTLACANETVFAPGDRLLLKAGSSYVGPLSLRGSGSAKAPIMAGAYGNGARPSIANPPGNGAILSLYNGEFWEIAGLELSGGAIGVFAYAKDFGIAHHLHLRNLYIHDVKGSTTGDDGGFLCKREGEDTWFEDLRIEGCTIEHADRNGILLTDYPTASDKHHSTDVLIRGNHLRDIGGDGIFILGCDDAVIEHNVLRYAHQRVDRRPGERACAGIWPHRCNRTTIQFNEVGHTAVGGETVWDSEAFDDDNTCRDTVFQYNYSHDNAGGFLLMCGGARGTIARYNISQNDAVALFTLEGDGTGGVTAYNNTFYVGPQLTVSLARNTFGAPSGLRFLNNLFYVDGVVNCKFGSIHGVTFDHNAFWGRFNNRPADPHAVLADPLLVGAGTGGEGLSSLGGYKLRSGSPCRAAGAPVPGNGGRDFFGRKLPLSRPPSIGADNG